MTSRGTGSSAGETEVRRPVDGGSGSSAGGDSGRTSGSLQSSGLTKRIETAMGANTTVTRARYLGRDRNGQPMYRITWVPTHAYRRFGDASMNFRTKTITFRNGQIGAPTLGQRVDNVGEQQQGDNLALQNAKTQWINTINNSNHSMAHKRGLLRAVDRYNGSVGGFNQMMAKIFKPTHGPVVIEEDPNQQWDDGFDPFAGIDFGGGGGGGFSGPEYVAPDRRVVEDMAKGLSVSLLGLENEAIVKAAADAYMKDHRKNFDSPNQEISPEQTMLETIRDSESYRMVHELRPDSEDERSWISQRRQAAKQGGLTTHLQEDFAITQAMTAGDVDDVVNAAGVAQTQHAGNVRGTTLEDKMRRVTTNMLREVRI